MNEIKKKNLNAESFNAVYSELAGTVGLDATLKIYLKYKGQQISFPTKLFSNEYIEEQIIEEFDGRNYRSIAQKYDYSERWIREIVKKHLAKG